MNSVDSKRKDSANILERLQSSLQQKERQAIEAREKGMHSSFSLLMEEIIELRRRVRQKMMGGK